MLGRVSIIGLGLIGGSLGAALQESGTAAAVEGYDASPQVRREARRLGLAAVRESLAEAVRAADLIVLAVPLAALGSVAQELASCRPAASVVTDTASVKAPVVTQLQAAFGHAFLGGHPMAGSEDSGPTAARKDLFSGAAYVLTPSAHTSARAKERVEQLVRAVKAHPVWRDPQEHDEQVARISHLPHLLAAALALATQNCPPCVELAAGGWRDTTRVASGPAQLYADILSANRTALSGALDRLQQELDGLRKSLHADDGSLQQLLCRAQNFRQWAGQERGWS